MQALMIVFSGLWLPKAGNLPLPIVAFLYWLARAYYSNFVISVKVLNPIICLICALTVFIFHFGNSEVDQLLSFSRVVLPHCSAVLVVACLGKLNIARYWRLLSVFMAIMLLAVVADLSPFALSPKAALFAQFSPYDIKDKTLFFTDSNWSGFFLCATDSVSRAGNLNRPLWWRVAAPILVYFSGSRSSLVYFAITILFDAILMLCGNMGRYLKAWASLPLERRRPASILLSACLVLPMIFPIFNFFVLQSGDIIPASREGSVSFSTQDGSLQTKMQIVRYAAEALDSTASFLVGNGPKVIKIQTTYSGHSLIGILPEIGILGILSYTLPMFICVTRDPSSFISIASLSLLSSTSFFPMAYMAPFLALWAAAPRESRV